MGGQSLAGGESEVVPNVEYDEGFRHDFLWHNNTKEHKSVDVNLIAGELMSFE